MGRGPQGGAGTIGRLRVRTGQLVEGRLRAVRARTKGHPPLGQDRRGQIVVQSTGQDHLGRSETASRSPPMPEHQGERDLPCRTGTSRAGGGDKKQGCRQGRSTRGRQAGSSETKGQGGDDRVDTKVTEGDGLNSAVEERAQVVGLERRRGREGGKHRTGDHGHGGMSDTRHSSRNAAHSA